MSVYDFTHYLPLWCSIYHHSKSQSNWPALIAKIQRILFFAPIKVPEELLSEWWVIKSPFFSSKTPVFTDMQKVTLSHSLGRFSRWKINFVNLFLNSFQEKAIVLPESIYWLHPGFCVSKAQCQSIINFLNNWCYFQLHCSPVFSKMLLSKWWL